MALTTEELTAVFRRCTAKIHEVAPELNVLDGRLGDGDLGATLEKCASLIDQALEKPPADIAAVFKTASLACMRASGSSFGTLLGVALLTSATFCADRKTLESRDFAPLLQTVLEALMARGGAGLGDKTVLDPLAAVQHALRESGDTGQFPALAVQAVKTTLEAYRQKPNKIGRARMFAERSIGMDDPGMVAFLYLVEAAANPVNPGEEI